MDGDCSWIAQAAGAFLLPGRTHSWHLHPAAAAAQAYLDCKRICPDLLPAFQICQAPHVEPMQPSLLHERALPGELFYSSGQQSAGYPECVRTGIGSKRQPNKFASANERTTRTEIAKPNQNLLARISGGQTSPESGYSYAVGRAPMQQLRNHAAPNTGYKIPCLAHCARSTLCVDVPPPAATAPAAACRSCAKASRVRRCRCCAQAYSMRSHSCWRSRWRCARCDSWPDTPVVEKLVPARVSEA